MLCKCYSLSLPWFIASLLCVLQDNIKLKSQVHGQESVIEGLRAERKLWEHELAQQGKRKTVKI